MIREYSADSEVTIWVTDVNGVNALLDIYSYYVEQTSIWLLIADGWEIHYLVAELNGKTVGYAYAFLWANGL